MGKLYELVGNSLSVSEPFKLFIPPNTDLDPCKTFWNLQMAPTSLVHFKFVERRNGQSYILPSLIDQAQDFPTITANNVASSIEPSSSQVLDNQIEPPPPHQRLEGGDFRTSSSAQSERKVPKWFKIGQK